jgi:hypothetical protein
MNRTQDFTWKADVEPLHTFGPRGCFHLPWGWRVIWFSDAPVELPPKLATFRGSLPAYGWRKDLPHEPGLWLSLYWDHSRRFVDRWNIGEDLHLPADRKPDWLWFGPIKLPTKDEL